MWGVRTLGASCSHGWVAMLLSLTVTGFEGAGSSGAALLLRLELVRVVLCLWSMVEDREGRGAARDTCSNQEGRRRRRKSE